MYDKAYYFNEAWRLINNCEHWTIRELANHLPREMTQGREYTEPETRLVMIGRLAERLTLNGGNHQATVSKIKELRKKKGW